MSKLTVLMTVYNGQTFLAETMESILNQTYRDFRFLIVDNASTDKSRDIIRSYNDPRIDLVQLPQNIGQVAALNKGLTLIDTPLIARMDADDLNAPNRFEQQVEYMEKHPQVGIVGSMVIAFDGKTENRWPWPCSYDDIKVKLLFECCMPHPSVMMRKSLLDKHNLHYNEEIGHSFDWELWQRAAHCFPVVNLPEYHLRYRLHASNESAKTLHLQRQAAQYIDSQTLPHLGLESHPLRKYHRDVGSETLNISDREPGFIDGVLGWFDAIRAANRRTNTYNPEALERFLRQRLFKVLNANTRHTREVLKHFFKFHLHKDIGFPRTLKFLTKTFLSIFRLFRS